LRSSERLHGIRKESAKECNLFTEQLGLVLATRSSITVSLSLFFNKANTKNFADEILPASPSWREFTVAFYKFLSAGSPDDSTKFPITANPIRLMPGGLERIVSDGFSLLGYGKVSDRDVHPNSEEEWLKPISGEKLVYTIGS